jgi:hypothetical protein
MYEALYQKTIKIESITGETKSPYGTNSRKTTLSTQSTPEGGVAFFFTSAVVMGEMFMLGCLIGYAVRDIWADSLY